MPTFSIEIKHVGNVHEANLLRPIRAFDKGWKAYKIVYHMLPWSKKLCKSCKTFQWL